MSDAYCKRHKSTVSAIVNKAIGIVVSDMNLKKKDNWTVISLFSGCGGMDLGFIGGFDYLGKRYDNLPFEIVFANDIDAKACLEYENFFKHKPITGDIKAYLDKLIDNKKAGNDELLPVEVKRLPKECDVVIGGFPCQDFSVAGKRNGFSSERGRLYQQMKRVVEYSNPKIFIAENVKGLTNLGEAINIIKNDFSNTGKFGYNITHNLLHAANYGVPQTRERVFIIGVRGDLDDKKFVFPPETHSADTDSDLPYWITAERAIADLGLEDSKIPNSNQYSKARNYGSHLQGNKRIKSDFPAPTIRAEHHGNIEFHYSLNRRLTVRECARIQSFPDEFVFMTSPSSAYKLIGNAVPPLLAWNIAKSVANSLNSWCYYAEA
jgi:DNA (cytosine-5)-methyltransferase 1